MPSEMDNVAGSCTWSDFPVGLGPRTMLCSGMGSGIVVGSGSGSVVGSGRMSMMGVGCGWMISGVGLVTSSSAGETVNTDQQITSTRSTNHQHPLHKFS